MPSARTALYHHRTQGRDVEAVHIRGLAGGLEQLGYSVEIIGPPGVDTDPDRVRPSPAGSGRGAWSWVSRNTPQWLFEILEIGYNVVQTPRLWRRCRALQPELIYERYALYNAAGVLAGRLAGTPLVLEVNDLVSMDRTRQGKQVRMRRLAGWFERRILEHAHSVVVVSGYLRDRLLEQGLPPHKVRMTPNAVDAAWFDPVRVREAALALRKRHGLASATVIGFAGSFAKWHGIDILVRGFAELVDEFPGTRLLLVGDGARRGHAEELVRELGIADRVTFTGRVPHREMPEYVAAMDIGVMPQSNAFGSPMKVFEYMAMGVPPVAPRYAPLEEAIDDGKDGLLFTPQDEMGLTRCLRALLEDPELRADLGEAAQRKVLAHHQWVHNAEVVIDSVGSHRRRQGGRNARRRAAAI